MTWEQIANFGVLGVVLAWFMLRLERRIEELTKVISDLKEAINKINVS